jgi:membrane-associated protease RseP (regulator of RpoE activity)
MMKGQDHTVIHALLVGGMILVIAAAFWGINQKQAHAGTDECGFLGVYLGKDIDEGKGALIDDVVEDGPAEAAGLKGGDVIFSFNGKDVDDIAHLRKMICKTDPGEKIAVVVDRDGKKMDFEVEMGEPKPMKLTVWSDKYGDAFKHFQMGKGWAGKKAWKCYASCYDCGDRGWLGVELQDLSEQLGEYFKVEDGEGALISSVKEDSPAEKGGLKAGDVIVMLDDKEVDGSDELIKLMCKTEPGDEVTVNVIRKGKKKKMTVTLGEAPEKHGCGHAGDCFTIGAGDCYPGDFEKRVMIKHISGLDEIHELEGLEDCLKDIEIDIDLPMEELKIEMEHLKQELEKLKQELEEDEEDDD